MTDRLFRFSETTTFIQSRPKYLIKYIMKLQKKYPDPQRPVQAFDIGTIGHKGLEAVYRKHSTAFATTAMRALARKLDIYDTDKLQVQMAFDAFDRHLQWLNESRVDEGHETIAVEKRLFLPMGLVGGDSVILTGAPDLVQRDKFGSLVVRDWKFVTDYGRLNSWINANRQGLTYAALVGEAHGQLPIRFDLRQIHRKPPKTKTYTVSEVATQWISPDVVTRHMEKMRRTIADMVQLHQEVEAGDFSGVYGDPSLCAIYGPCTDYDVCCGAVSKSPEQIAEILAAAYEPTKEDL